MLIQESATVRQAYELFITSNEATGLNQISLSVSGDTFVKCNFVPELMDSALDK
jgi:hypothetical protein